MQGSIGADQDSRGDSTTVLWRPSVADRQECKLADSVNLISIARVSYGTAAYSHQLSVFKAEWPERLVFAASLFDQTKSDATKARIECLWNLDYSRYLRSSEVKIGPARRAVRIDVENPTGEVQVALIAGEIDGKTARLFNFRSVETCPSGLEPCWNYSRTMTVLPSPDKSPFYDVRIDTGSWCRLKGASKCTPETGPQEYKTYHVLKFENKKYH